MQEVVLDETVVMAPATGDDAVGAAPPAGGARWWQPRTGRRRGGWRWWPVVALLALAAVAGSMIADQRASTRLANLAAIPGFLAPLDGPVRPLWRSDRAQFSDLTQIGGRLVGVEHHTDGSVDVVALDHRTGKAVWHVAARPPSELDTWATCAGPQAPRPTRDRVPTLVVVCVVVDRAATHENAAGVWPYATKSRLLVLGAATGAVVSEAPTEPSTAVAAIGADLVVSSVSADGRVHVARTDPLRSTTRWTFTSPTPIPADPSGRPQASVSVVDNLIVVTAGSGWVLSGAGTVIDSWTGDATTWGGGRAAVLNAGRVLAETGTRESGASGSTFRDVATKRSFRADVDSIPASPDDGSLADLVFTQSARDDDLVAYDVASGRPRWTALGAAGDAMAGGGLVVVDGRVIRAEAGQLRSIDGRTGETIWATPVGSPAQGPLFSDGLVVLRTQNEPGRGTVLAAYGLDDGRPRWQTDVAANSALVAISGKLYEESNQGLLALG
jgi:outer membrane protein assembly factor BamB